MARVLFAVTGSRHWTLNDGTQHPCGYWPEELAVPHEVFAAAALQITVATPGAVSPVPDEAGFTPEMNGGSGGPGGRYSADLHRSPAPVAATGGLHQGRPRGIDR